MHNTSKTLFLHGTSAPSWISEWLIEKETSKFQRTGKTRSFLESSPLFGYGCWCHYGPNSINEAGGTVKDQYDGVCKELIECYRCARLQTRCSPLESPYQTNTISYLSNPGDLTVCDTDSNRDNGPGECKWQTCY